MVHALEEIHRLLRPGGCLLDIHPLPAESFVEVRHGRKPALVEPVPASNVDDIRAGEEALDRAVQRRLFRVERAISFDFLTYALSVAEMLDYYKEANAFDEGSSDEGSAAWLSELAPQVEQAMRAAQEGAQIVYREQAKITRMRRIAG